MPAGPAPQKHSSCLRAAAGQDLPMQQEPREAGEDAGAGEAACPPAEEGPEGAMSVPSTISQLHGHRLYFQPFVCLNFPIPLPPAACSQPVCWDLPRV